MGERKVQASDVFTLLLISGPYRLPSASPALILASNCHPMMDPDTFHISHFAGNAFVYALTFPFLTAMRRGLAVMQMV